MHTITQLAPDDIPAAAEVIRQAFATVAEAFDLTEENCPTNGAFLRDAALAEEQERGTVLYGLSDEDGLSGCMALKRKDEATFSLEKLAVEPEPGIRRGAGGARRGGGAAVRRRNDLHRGHVRKQETGALVRAAGLQHYGNPEVRAPPVRGVFHGEERVRAGRLGQGGARVGCGVRKIDQAFNLDD